MRTAVESSLARRPRCSCLCTRRKFGMFDMLMFLLVTVISSTNNQRVCLPTTFSQPPFSHAAFWDAFCPQPKLAQGARTLFTGLFEALSDLSDLAAPMIDVDEVSKLVFLIWRCPASGFLEATDTFLIDGKTNKIFRQNVAYKSS